MRGKCDWCRLCKNTALVKGANSYGQLGLGNQDDQLLPQRVTLPDSAGAPPQNQPMAKRIRSLTGGGGHSIIIQDDGSVFACGSNCKGQLGLNHYNDEPVFMRVNLPAVVHKVSPGWDFTVILSEKGEVFVCGSNEFGQLGFHPKELQHTPIPMKVLLPASYGQIVDVAAGMRHTAVLTAEGKVFCWGMRRKIQVEDLLNEAVKKSLEIPVLESAEGDPFVKMCAGSFHTLVLTASGRVYSWGRGNYGQLGRSCDQSHSGIPQQIKELYSIKSMECGSEHNLVTTDDGRLFTWGWNEHGMCATGDEDNVERPTVVKALSDLLAVDCASGAGHCLVLCKDKT